MLEKILFKIPMLCAFLGVTYWGYDVLFESGYKETNHSLYMLIITFFLSWNLTLHSINNGPKLFCITWGVCIVWVYGPDLVGIGFGPIAQTLVMLVPLPAFIVYHFFSEQAG